MDVQNPDNCPVCGRTYNSKVRKRTTSTAPVLGSDDGVVHEHDGVHYIHTDDLKP